MADSSFLQSNKELKLIDNGDGTYLQAISGTVSVAGGISIGSVSIDTVGLSGGTVTVVETLLNGTVSMVTATINAVTNLTKGTVTVVQTLLNGTVSLTGAIATAPSHPTYAVTSVSQTVSATSATRKYLLIANNTDTTLWLGLGTASVVEKGIPLFANGSAYEMSTAMGNLFTGDVAAINSGGTVSKTIQVVEG
jgi:hypothetical protein